MNSTPAEGDSEIPDSKYWTKLHDAYFQAKSMLPDIDTKYDDSLANILQDSDNGAVIQFAIQKGEFGRGLFAKQLIKQGTPVWNCERAGVFHNEQQWLAFLKLLPPHMQYDCSQWAYATDGIVYLDLEPASMLNHGGSTIEQYPSYYIIRPNNLEGAEIPNSQNQCYIAKCDIMPGDELLCDYTKFHDFAKPLEWLEECYERIVENGYYY